MASDPGVVALGKVGYSTALKGHYQAGSIVPKNSEVNNYIWNPEKNISYSIFALKTASKRPVFHAINQTLETLDQQFCQEAR